MKRGRLLRIAAILYLVLVYATLYLLYPEAFTLNPTPLLTLSFLLATAAEILRGIRIALLYSCITRRFDYRRGVEARFAGNIVALLTPSVAGGEVVRGLVLHGGVEAEAIPAIGAAAVDGGIDLIGNYLLALSALAASSAPAAPLPELLALAPFAAWVFGLLLVASGRFARLAVHLAERMRGHRLLDRFASWAARLERLRVKPRTALLALAITMAAWLLEAASYTVAATLDPLWSCGCVAELMLMGIIPTPGGIGPGEALLAAKCPGIATWRMIYLMASTLPGIPVFLAGVRRGSQS